MGARGPTPKPSARRQRRNKTTSPKLASVSSGGPGAESKSTDAPRPRKEWLVQTKERWAAYWGSTLARLADRVADMPAIERLFDLYDERERAQRAYRRKRIVVGSMGQPVLNPLGRIIKEYDVEIRMLEDRFGLTPAARQRMHVEEDDDPSADLDELNRQLARDDDADDPRLTVIKGGASAK
jgi:P27 family predicted phage terminase small subunit